MVRSGKVGSFFGYGLALARIGDAESLTRAASFPGVIERPDLLVLCSLSTLEAPVRESSEKVQYAVCGSLECRPCTFHHRVHPCGECRSGEYRKSMESTRKAVISAHRMPV